MAAITMPKGRYPLAPRNGHRVRQATRYQLRLLRRAKLLTPAGAPIHFGVGTYDTQIREYIEVFHSTPERHEHSVTFPEFEGGCLVERVLVDPVAGVWERLAMCKLNPQLWSADHNCQHTASWIYFGIEESPTLEVMKATAGFALTFGAFALITAG